MKKMLFIAVVIGMMSSNLIAGVIGKVTAVNSYGSGATFTVEVTPDGGTPVLKGLVGADADSFKALLAHVLSAQAGGLTVDARITGNDWAGFTIK